MGVCKLGRTARARDRRFGLLSALRANTTAPYKNDLLWETLRARNRPGGYRPSWQCASADTNLQDRTRLTHSDEMRRVKRVESSDSLNLDRYTLD